MIVSLLVSDKMHSPQLSRSNGQNELLFRHGPFGTDKAAGAKNNFPGFNGQRRDPVSSSYHLGNGYRAYNPVLMRFNCPDSLSPFGRGGINPYTYCLGDPINRADPTGHISWQTGVGIGLGVLSIIATLGAGAVALSVSGGIGAALAATSGTTLISGGLGLVSGVVGVASISFAENAPELSATLGWVSLGLGIAGIGVGSLSAFKSAKFLRAAKVKKVPANSSLKNPSVRLGEPMNVHRMFDTEVNALAYAELNYENAISYANSLTDKLTKIRNNRIDLARSAYLSETEWPGVYNDIMRQAKRLERYESLLKEKTDAMYKTVEIYRRRFNEKLKMDGAPHYLHLSSTLPTYDEYELFTKVKF